MVAKKEQIGLASTMLSRDNGGVKNVNLICKQALKKYEKYFLSKGRPKIFVGKECITVEFFVKKNYSRSYNLEKFELLAKEMVKSILLAFKNNKIKIKFWAASGTDLEFVMEQ